MKFFLFVLCAIFVVISAEFSETYNSEEDSGDSYNYPDHNTEQNYGHLSSSSGPISSGSSSEHEEKSPFSSTTYGDNYAGEIKDDSTTSSDSNYNFPSNHYNGQQQYTGQSYTGSDTNYNYPSSSYDHNSGHQISDAKYSYPSYGYNYGSSPYFTGQSDYSKFTFPGTSSFSGYDSAGHGHGHGHGQLLSENVEVTKQVHIPVYKQQQVKIPFSVPVPLPKPVIVKVPQPYPVQILVPHAVPFPVVKTINYTVEKEVPEPVIKEVQFKYDKLVPVEVPVPKRYPVYIPVYKHIYVGKKSKPKRFFIKNNH